MTFEHTTYRARLTLPRGYPDEREIREFALTLPRSTHSDKKVEFKDHVLVGEVTHCDECLHRWLEWKVLLCKENIFPVSCPFCSYWETKDKTRFFWDEISDRHLKNIVRYLVRSKRSDWKRIDKLRPHQKSFWRSMNPRYISPPDLKLHFAINECRYRGLLPTQEELQMMWEKGIFYGKFTEINPPWDLVELWVNSEETKSPEYIANERK